MPQLYKIGCPYNAEFDADSKNALGFFLRCVVMELLRFFGISLIYKCTVWDNVFKMPQLYKIGCPYNGEFDADSKNALGFFLRCVFMELLRFFGISLIYFIGRPFQNASNLQNKVSI